MRPIPQKLSMLSRLGWLFLLIFLILLNSMPMPVLAPVNELAVLMTTLFLQIIDEKMP